VIDDRSDFLGIFSPYILHQAHQVTNDVSKSLMVDYTNSSLLSKNLVSSTVSRKFISGILWVTFTLVRYVCSCRTMRFS
jgi:hypothetical protein